MKTNNLYIFSLLISLGALGACDPMEDNDHSLGNAPQESQLAFSVTPQSGQPNIVVLKNESSVAGVAVWNLGNGATGKGSTVTAQYPFAGTYEITMTLSTQGGSVSVSHQLVIADDDMALLNTPMYNALTGGADNLAGKTWVFDQYHEGHFGVGPADAATPEWWSCPPEGKEGCSLYSQQFTFTQVGVKLEWKNNGYVYTNAAGLAALGGEYVEDPGGAGDYDVAFTPAATYTFSLDEASKTLTLKNGAFFGHYAGTGVYEIISLTDDELYVKCRSGVESGNGWWYRFIPIEKNVKPEVVIPLKGIELKEDFEKDEPIVVFAGEEMGENSATGYSNPAPVPLNTSRKVYLYEKSASFYTNLSFMATGYKFDLSQVNKVRMKVFIPEYNDYLTEGEVAGEWITNRRLLPQVAVKLQDSSKGGNAWETQVELTKTDLEKGKWLDLEFDFSVVSERTDLDKIVIQFGAEGHSIPGIFFFDDFSFGK